MCGQGKQTFPDGRQCSGNFKGGMINGKGEVSYGDGRMYEGEMLDNKPHG